jgi:hypothetical protein
LLFQQFQHITHQLIIAFVFEKEWTFGAVMPFGVTNFDSFNNLFSVNHPTSPPLAIFERDVKR